MILVWVGVGLAWPQLATAQDMSRAQSLFQSGVEMADAERWGEAAEYFRQARAIVERPSIVCNLGVALHHLGETTDAIEALQRCRALAEEDAAWGASNRALVERAGRLLDELRPSMGRLTLTLAPETTEVFLDGTPLEGTGASRTLEVDPGRHHLTLSAAGYVSRTEEISVLSGQIDARTFTLQALPAHPATLVVEGLDDAVVTIDGAEVGLGHVEQQLAAGVHELDVRAPGRDPFHRTVTLGAGERLVVDARGSAGSASGAASTGTSIAEEPLFWVGIGGGVLVIAGAIVLGVVLSQPNDPLAGYNGSTGVVLTPLVASF